MSFSTEVLERDVAAACARLRARAATSGAGDAGAGNRNVVGEVNGHADNLAGRDATQAGPHPKGLIEDQQAPTTDASLLDALAAFTKVKRDVDAVLANIASEIARRSTRDAGAGGLAKKAGFQTPEALVAGSTGGSRAEAGRLIRAGAAAGNGSSFFAPTATPASKEPPRFPHLAAALGAGDISIEACQVVTSMLDRTEGRADPGQWRDAELLLAERARTLSLEHLSKFARQLEAKLDPEGLRATEEALKNDRYLIITEDRAGAIVMKGRLDPETAAPIKTAVDALVAAALHRQRDNDHSDPNRRSAAQMRADALSEICLHALGCKRSAPTFAKTTIVVRLSMADLKSGKGSAMIDGLSHPISVASARAMAADGQVLPIVLGGKGEVLDLGRAKRPFNTAQRIALGERDGGCAWCGAPPSFTEAHHIKWWEHGGPTDLVNGLLLCVACHHRVHRDNWEINIHDGDVWFTPPKEVDPARTPRLGGRKHFEPPGKVARMS